MEIEMCNQENQMNSKKASEKAKPTTKDALFANLTSSREFTDDLKRVAKLLDAEKGSGLKVGQIAHRWIGDRRT